MHSSSNIWMIAPFLSLVYGVILISRRLRSYAHENPTEKKEPSKATMFALRAILLLSGLLLIFISALLAFGFVKR
jgi:hypothetical protein